MKQFMLACALLALLCACGGESQSPPQVPLSSEALSEPESVPEAPPAVREEESSNQSAAVEAGAEVSDILDGENEETSPNQLAGDWEAGDGSLLCLAEDGTFLWYRYPDDRTDNYYSGTYQVRWSGDAVVYISEDLAKYGLTLEEQMQFLLSGRYKPLDYCCLELHNQECIVEGVNTLENPMATPYYGFAVEGPALNLVNMNTGNEQRFVKVPEKAE